ncbi:MULTISPECIES: PhzF family phenazine biosynthesis protein [Vibrio]|uniref:PhzF family phenazine biosynthesis isomerase n=2 Tax=Vibrio TaxID=662 RepID=A0A7X4LN21_9VIBR|nr:MULTISPECIES: PhzF family phenazine biosynthesis protein [Vibrio]MBF9002284.1 PhzF family phenazine biosynthesis protein [Vibrio nitrifigilis]MZI94934.1 PhzF family phenazine biosynthesis isomerase [Vibrio eleionomae]
MELNIYQVDAFTSQPFSGNPAGVCITQSPLEESLMLAIAKEMALSETAFLDTSTMILRWFTPEIEVALCGHATLATAHVMKESGLASVGDIVEFNTQSGVLQAKLEDQQIILDFPAAELLPAEVAQEKLTLLTIDAKEVVSYQQFASKDLIQIESVQSLRALTPSFERLKQFPGRGVVVTAPADDPELDFVSRYFAPWVGVNEDPVTGTAHCALAVYWSPLLNKTRMRGYQASTRGGYVEMEYCHTNKRVKLYGSAHTVIKGVLFV